MQKIVEQLHVELKRFQATPKSITSLFIGGGTPSTIPASWYESFFVTIRPYLSDDVEITSEANPHSATNEWLTGMFALGVNRISFGVQSFQHDKLKFLGRNHTPQIAIKALQTAQTVGFKNLSVDLIYGVAGDTLERLNDDLQIARSLPINHISAYALTQEEETPFYERTDVVNASESLAKAFVEKIIDAGFPQYEISNFGTYQSRHNKGYWEHDDYLGIGAGAVGCLQTQRFYPTKEIEAYVNNPLLHTVEELSTEDRHIEMIFLGLRSIIGIEKEHFTPNERERVELLLREGKLDEKEGRVYNNDYFLSDEIALFITQ